MSKRSTSYSPVEGSSFKKQKVVQGADTSAATVPGTPVTSPTATNPAKDLDAATISQIKPVNSPNNPVAAEKASGKAKQPPIGTLFTPFKPTITVPASNPFWGLKPRTGDPRPHPDQPSARSSNAATNPPLWEDRGFRIKRGSRHVKYFGPLEPEGADAGPDFDQEDLLVLKLIDMRVKSKKDQTPRRMPTFYVFDAGKPNDWNSLQAIKALNDRRGQAIDRITVDAPWQKVEREYLAALLVEFPDASIWELTERHNDRFMDADYTVATGFAFAELSTGRTVESVRHEYMTYKPAYDRGEVSQGVRWRSDRSIAGKAIKNAKTMEKAFGLPDKKLEKESDAGAESGDNASDDESGGEGTDKAVAKKSKKTTKSQKKVTKKSEALVEPLITPENETTLQTAAATDMAAQPKLNDDDEELLALAGIHYPEEIRTSPPHSPAANPRSRASSIASSGLSDVPSDLVAHESQSPRQWQTESSMSALAAREPVPEKAVKQTVVEQGVTALVAPKHTAEKVVEETIVQDATVTIVYAAALESPSVSPKTVTACRPARAIFIDEDYDDEEL
jgi:hypothetical protein